MNYPVLEIDQHKPDDLIIMGRVAVDLYAEQIGSSLSDAATFRKYLGGCAGNIAVGTARLGLKSALFSCVGQDEMGVFLKKTLLQEGVNIDLLQETAQHLTGLVLLGVKPPTEFPLMFYRQDCADMQLQPEQLPLSRIKDAKALLITGTGLSTAAMLTTSLAIVKQAKSAKTAVIIDLDYRPVLWGLTPRGDGATRYLSDQRITAVYQQVLPDCNLIVGTSEEICIAGGSDDMTEALQNIRKLSQAPLVIKTGEKGCQVFFAEHSTPLQSKPFPVPVLNVLGAGDGFMSGLLRGLLRDESWETATTYANACGALVVTRHGCSPAIPYWPELNHFIHHFDEDPFVWKSQELNKFHQGADTLAPSTILIKRPEGFMDGINQIVRMHQSAIYTGMNFTVVKLRDGQTYPFNPDYEFAALLMTGRVIFRYPHDSKEVECKVQRSDYFSQLPYVLHCPASCQASVEALTDCEILLIETENTSPFLPMMFDETNLLECDHRGKGLLEDTAYRIVRTVFDKRNRPESNLVVGEIITFQGRWSSYPPHHHDQPEIYHYRFSEPQGFAFGENGREVLRIEHNDTYQIADGQEHAHCTAPGYAMYTLWFIRHQPDNPYIKPTFLAEHAWTRQLSANQRQWHLKEECS